MSAARDSHKTLTPGAQIEWIAPSEDLRELVNTLFILRVGKGRREDMMPAYSAQLCVFVKGQVSIQHADGSLGHSGAITFNAPLLQAAPIVMQGPIINVGASFTPLGWAAVSNLPVDTVHNVTLEADTVVADKHLADLTEQLKRCRKSEIVPQALCAPIEAMIRSAAKANERTNRSDHRAMIAAIESWLSGSLNPPVAELYDSVDLSPRQIQRLCKRYFGVPPAQLVKRYRAIRAAMLLANDDLSGDLRDDALGSYFDQAHLIHDLRRFTGRTPKRLAKDQLSQDFLDPNAHGRSADVVRSDDFED